MFALVVCGCPAPALKGQLPVTFRCVSAPFWYVKMFCRDLLTNHPLIQVCCTRKRIKTWRIPANDE